MSLGLKYKNHEQIFALGLVLGNAYEWVGMAGIYGIVVIAALVLIVPNFIKTKGKVINYVEED